MIKSRKFFVVLVMTALGLTTGASVVEADPPANSPWSLETIASITGGDVGQYNSIAFSEASGKPYISYYDETNRDLRLIYPHATAGNCGPNNEWYCEAPDTVGDVGQYSSIDYYADSVAGIYRIGIAYYDVTNDTLKVAIWASDAFPSPGWTVSTIDSGSEPGYYWVGRSSGDAHPRGALCDLRGQRRELRTGDRGRKVAVRHLRVILGLPRFAYFSGSDERRYTRCCLLGFRFRPHVYLRKEWCELALRGH